MRRAVKRVLSAILASSLALPFVAQADISITEIMYDASGSDDGREWIEIDNSDTLSYPLKDLRFANGDGRHLLKSVNGENVTLPKGCFVVAEDVYKFKLDFPAYSSAIILSSFSLPNSSDNLSLLKMADSRTVEKTFDSVSYSKDRGAAGDGKSLARDGDTWVATTPTPGLCSTLSSEVGTAPSMGTTTITAYIEGPREIAVGSEVVFRATTLGLEGKPITNARYVWNFGDGSIKEGQAVSHTWSEPGMFTVSLESSSSIWTADASLKLEVKKTLANAAPIIKQTPAAPTAVEKTQAGADRSLSIGQELPADKGAAASQAVLFSKSASRPSGHLEWYLALGGLIGVASLGVLFSTGAKANMAQAGSKQAVPLKADDFEIIELKDNEQA